MDVAFLLTRQVRPNSGSPTRYAGGPLSLSMFLIAYAKFACDFSARIFLIVPKLHHNAAVPKLSFCKSLSPKMLVGARGFEPRTSCAQGRSSAVHRVAQEEALVDSEFGNIPMRATGQGWACHSYREIEIRSQCSNFVPRVRP